MEETGPPPLGLEPIAEADEEQWREMWESNVLGTLRMTRGLLGTLIASGDGLVVNVLRRRL